MTYLKRIIGIVLIIAAFGTAYLGVHGIRAALSQKEKLEVQYDEKTAQLDRVEGILEKLDAEKKDYLDYVDKVEDGEKKLTDGEDALADGEAEYADAASGLAEAKKGLAGLGDTIKALRTVKKGYDKQWHPGFAKKVSDKELAKLMAGKKIKKQPGLAQSRKLISKTLSSEEGSGIIAMAESMSGMKDLAKDIDDDATYREFDKALKRIIKALKKADKSLDKLNQAAEMFKISDIKDKSDGSDSGGSDKQDQQELSPETIALIQALTGKDISKVTASDIKEAVKSAGKSLDSLKNTLKAWRKGYKLLKKGKDGLADREKGIPFAFRQMLSESTVRSALDKKTVAVMKKYSGNRLASDDLDEFDRDMKTVSKVLGKLIKKLSSVRRSGQKAYSRGLKAYREAPQKLEDARKKLRNGRAGVASAEAMIEDYDVLQDHAREELEELTGTEPEKDKDGLLDADKGLTSIEECRTQLTGDTEAQSKAIDKDLMTSAAELCASLLMLILGSILMLKSRKRQKR